MKKLFSALSALFLIFSVTIPAFATEPQNNATAPTYGTLIDYKEIVHNDGSTTEEYIYATPLVQPMTDTVSGSTTVTKVFTERDTASIVMFSYSLQASFTFNESKDTVSVGLYSGKFIEKDKATFSTPSVTSSGSGTSSASVKYSLTRKTQFGISTTYRGTLSCSSAGVVS